MKTTHLGIETGGLTYDGGAELVMGQNLDKIVAELTRLAALAGVAAPTGFITQGAVWDAGQERAARNNLARIQSTLKIIATAASSPSTLTLDTGLAATDGGTSKVMTKNLALIDSECARLDAILDGGGGGYVPPPATGNWVTGAGVIVMQIGAVDSGDPAMPFQGGFALIEMGMEIGTGQNVIIDTHRMPMCLFTVMREEGVDTSSVQLQFRSHANPETPTADPALVGRNVVLRYQGDVIWTGALGAMANVSATLATNPPFADGGYAVLEVAAP